MSTTQPAQASTSTCKLPRCTQGPVHSWGLCKHHAYKQWQLKVQRGEYQRVDTDMVRYHLDGLRRRGWTYPMIEAKVSVSSRTLAKIVDGDLTELRIDKARAILALPITWQATTLSVPAVGTERRLSALAWQGWSAAEMCRRSTDVTLNTVRHALARGRLEARNAVAIAAFYEEHIGQPGPSPRYAQEARTKGAIPAAAWDGDLDDPDLQPEGVAAPESGRRTAAVLVENYDDLIAKGLSAEQAAAQLGIQPDSIGNARRRVKVSAARRAQSISKEEAA